MVVFWGHRHGASIHRYGHSVYFNTPVFTVAFISQEWVNCELWLNSLLYESSDKTSRTYVWHTYPGIYFQHHLPAPFCRGATVRQYKYCSNNVWDRLPDIPAVCVRRMHHQARKALSPRAGLNQSNSRPARCLALPSFVSLIAAECGKPALGASTSLLRVINYTLLNALRLPLVPRFPAPLSFV